MKRLDVILTERNIFESRQKAQNAIKDGIVFSNNKKLTKPSLKFNDDIEIEILGEVMPYVSRGGLKLEKALDTFDIDLDDKVMLDIGSSTGGFTDCALQNGIKLSYALDVGRDQLHDKLRYDERVVVMEQTNFRNSKIEDFKNGLPDIATIDVSFISLKLILPNLYTILKDGGDVIVLIKPQFEAGKKYLNKKGIIKDKKVHQMVKNDIISFSKELGFHFVDIVESPIQGGDGNTEFLMHLNK